MPKLLDKIARLTDAELAEGSLLLADATTDDLRFVLTALLMEQERRAGGEKGVKFNPYHGPDGRFSSGPGGGARRQPDSLDPAPKHSGARDISPQVKSTQALGGGVNATHIVHVENEDGISEKMVFKPIVGENPQVHPAFRGRQSINEVAASVVDDAMGLGLVARTELAQFEGRTGSLSKFVNDTAQLAVNLSDDAVLRAKRINDMFYYDALIGNTDRHQGNWLVKDGEVKLIDNGMSFAKNRDYDDDRLRFRGLENFSRERAFHRMSPQFKEGLKRLQANREGVTGKLKSLGLDDEQIDSFWKRADYMQRAGQLGFGDSTLRDLGRLAEGRDMFG